MTGMHLLVVRFGALGDVVLTTPLLRSLQRRHPDIAITFVTKRRYAPLLETDPHVNAVEALAPGESIRALAARLRVRPFDGGVDLHCNLRSWTLQRLVGGPWHRYDARRLRRRLAVWCGVGAVGPGSALATHVAQRYFKAVRHLDAAPDHGPPRLYTTPADRAAAATLVDPATVVLAPGTRHATKRWPARHWRDLAARLGAAGRPVVAVGLDEDRLVLRAPLVREAFGLPLRLVTAICARARVVVANDSGIMHVATAVDTPVVALYGPTAPALGHAPYRVQASLLARTLPCRPCSLSGGPVCPLSHHHCLETIEPADVETAIAHAT